MSLTYAQVKTNLLPPKLHEIKLLWIRIDLQRLRSFSMAAGIVALSVFGTMAYENREYAGLTNQLDRLDNLLAADNRTRAVARTLAMNVATLENIDKNSYILRREGLYRADRIAELGNTVPAKSLDHLSQIQDGWKMNGAIADADDLAAILASVAQVAPMIPAGVETVKQEDKSGLLQFQLAIGPVLLREAANNSAGGR